MSETKTAERISEAWNLHRSGDNDKAINIYSDILASAPQAVDKGSMDNPDVVRKVGDTIDAYYGIGLAHRDKGNTERAVEMFQKAHQMTSDALDGLGINAKEGGRNNLESFDDDRFLMLIRMIEQRLNDLDANVESQS